jgi:Protein of unknown function (DUF3710)
MFRRRKGAPEPEDTELGELADEADAEHDNEADSEVADEPAEDVPVAPVRPSGPWDLADVPDDGLTRLDLGCILVPGAAGMELQVNLDEAGGTVVAVTAVHGDSSLQLQAFAAPRSEGIWAEVRRELAAEITRDGGLADVRDSPAGPSLVAKLPFPQPNGSTALAPVRFIGCDGPRWFLRGVVTGPAAEDPATGAELFEVFAGTVVVRGNEAYAPRDPLALRLPAAVDGSAGESDAAAGHDREPLDINGTGQQISEIR